jgi:superfamily II DNA or RNA helicase
MDDEETIRLVQRFDGHRFDADVLPVKNAYSYLQEREILARVEQQVLRGGELTLNQTEMAQIDQFRVLPPTAEKRLGEDAGRNKRLLDRLCEMPSDWTVILFAASLEHARLLAVSLSMRGVPAQSISSDTPLGARRYYIDEFRAGHLRVLTNYGVLTTGFDAPAVRAICIARPVWSPGLYQQMIGRGLRGPKNGGKERCLIINVEDNISSYGERLAFYHFEYLWRSDRNAPEDRGT